jgi:glycosyltransferase involved in cell wall biosynthesis
VRVAYVTTYDSSDVRAWSGLGYYISRCLELAGSTVERVGPLDRRIGLRARFRQVEAKLQRREYAFDRDPDVVDAYAAQTTLLLESNSCDLVFSPGTIPVARLNSSLPVAFWCDATFGAMLRHYPDYRLLSKRAIRSGMELETRALAGASIACYASEWAARSAVEEHGADPERVEVAPFGANMPIDHDREAVVELVRRRATDSCRLLWVGVDWARKGGDRAIDIARVLNERGLPTELDIVGCTPRGPQPPWVRVHGFVDKATDSGMALLRHLYELTHVLVHPATAECFGVVFCEAAAHGVLSAAPRVGGIPSAVREGVTGALFERGASADEYADYVWRLLEDRRIYETAAIRAFDEYQRLLSWDVQAKRLGPRLARLA